MSCPIFRCQSINTLSDLDNSGKHNKREKDHYDSNPVKSKKVKTI